MIVQRAHCDCQNHVHGGLFGAAEASPLRQTVMATLDRIQARFGRSEVGAGHAGVKADKVWTMRRGRLSPLHDGLVPFAVRRGLTLANSSPESAFTTLARTEARFIT